MWGPKASRGKTQRDKQRITHTVASPALPCMMLTESGKRAGRILGTPLTRKGVRDQGLCWQGGIRATLGSPRCGPSATGSPALLETQSRSVLRRTDLPSVTDLQICITSAVAQLTEELRCPHKASALPNPLPEPGFNFSHLSQARVNSLDSEWDPR